MAAPTQSSLAFDREFAAAVAAAGEAAGITGPRPEYPVGDVKSRRKGFDEMFGKQISSFPDSPSVSTTQHSIPAADGSEIVLTEFRKGARPTTAGAAVYYIHGGGMVLGSVSMFAPLIKAKVDIGGLPLFAISYRLAPEHPHPTPINDCYAGLAWLSQHAAEVGVDPARIIVHGESAGGGLGAGVTLMARDKGLSPPVMAQMLMYPMIDDRTQTPMPEIEQFATYKVIDNITGWGALLGKHSGSETETEGHIYAAPARAKGLHGLPPTYIDVGQLDIFVVEDVKFALGLIEANVATEFHVYPGLPHAFEGAGAQTQVVKAALANRQRWLAQFV